MIKKEYILAVLIGGVVIILTNLYLISGILAPKMGMEFLGRRVTNSQDTYTYVAFIESSKQGNILFENLYSTDPQTKTLLRPSYLFLGQIGNIFSLSSISAYHAGRIIFSVLFLIILYIFLGMFFKTPKRRLFAFSFVLVSSGLGFVLGNFWKESADLWIPESITFASLQEAPHFIWSQTLMLISFMFLLKAWEKKRKVYLLFVCIPLLLLGFEHPYNLFVCLAAVVCASVYLWFARMIPRKFLASSVMVVFVSVILGNLYQLFELMRNPIFRSWAAPSDSPVPYNYILGYGFIILLALFGTEKYLKERKVEQVFILSWVATSSVLLYAPVYFQRRLSEGLHIPLSILAVEGVIILSLFISKFVVAKIRSYVVAFFSCVILCVLSIGSISNSYSEAAIISRDHQNSYYYYLLNQEVSAMKYIRDNTKSSDVVLSNWFYGNILPGVAGRRVYVGHKAQTNDFDKKVADINTFILNKDTKSAYKFLKDNSITYIYVGKNDSMLRFGFKPATKPYLQKVFDEGEVKVYRVK